MKTTMMAILVGASLLVACGGSSNNNNSPDMAMNNNLPDMSGPKFDMEQPPCIMNPVSGVDFLNACTDAQSGDPAKDYPYFPMLAPGGMLPPLQ
jgi:hypothetical protein